MVVRAVHQSPQFGIAPGAHASPMQGNMNLFNPGLQMDYGQLGSTGHYQSPIGRAWNWFKGLMTNKWVLGLGAALGGGYLFHRWQNGSSTDAFGGTDGKWTWDEKAKSFVSRSGEKVGKDPKVMIVAYPADNKDRNWVVKRWEFIRDENNPNGTYRLTVYDGKPNEKDRSKTNALPIAWEALPSPLRELRDKQTKKSA